MNDTVPPRGRAACLRTVCLRVGALVTATLTLTAVACATLPALASAHARTSARRPGTARGARRHAVRLVLARRRMRLAGATQEQTFADSARRGLPRRCIDAHVRIGRVTRLQTERATVCLLNRQRARRGLPPLRLNGRLDDSAQNWTNTMVRDHSFSHGASFASRISQVGFNWSQAGENIADGYLTPAGAVKAWMASTGHCQNILNPTFREVGAGFDRGSAIGRDARGTWTTDFGLLMNQHALSNNFSPAAGCPY